MDDPLDALDADDPTEADTAKAKRKAQRDIGDLQWLMAHKQGRRIAYKLLADAGVFRNPFNHSGSVTAFNCGQMNIGQQFMAAVTESAPEAYMQMLKEAKE